MTDVLRPGSALAPYNGFNRPAAASRLLQYSVFSIDRLKKGPQHRVCRVMCYVVPGSLKRSGMKTLDVVHFVETVGDDESPNLRKARRLVASTLLGALLDRIQHDNWEAALKVCLNYSFEMGFLITIILARSCEFY